VVRVFPWLPLSRLAFGLRCSFGWHGSFLHFSCGLLRMTPFRGPCISALAIACSKARDTSFRDILAHHGVSSMSCQWGSGPGIFHRTVAALIPLEFRAATILASMSFLSSLDKAVQSCMVWSITRLHPRRKGREIQTRTRPKSQFA